MSENDPKPPWAGWDREYREFQEREGIPVHTGFAIDDVRTLEVGQWERTGGRGAFINLVGMEGTCDLQLFEIPPASELEPQRHLHDLLVFVLNGSGFTTIGEGETETTFEWDDNAAFLVPKNTKYVHSNASDEPVRLLAQTPLPLLYSLLKRDEAIWDNDSFDEWESIISEDFYSSTAELKSGTGKDTRTYWDSNFIPNTSSFDKLAEWADRGGGGSSVFFPFPASAMWSHISEFSVGQYKKGHRHLGGANIILLSGEGYSLLWQDEGEDPSRIDWKPYSVFVPPTLWYHQHFNTSRDPARYFVFHSPIMGTGLHGTDNDAFEALHPRNQIEYHQEDPAIREQFERELEQADIAFQMDPEVYESEEGDHVLWGGETE